MMQTLDRLSQFNPLVGLTARGLVGHFQNGERGQYADLMWLFRYIEKRDAVIRAVKRRLTNALTALDWNIKVIEGFDENDAAKQQKALEDAYSKITNLRKALTFLALADMRGFSHVEKIYDRDWSVTELRIVPQWHWVRNGVYGAWCYNPQADSTFDPRTPVDQAHYVIREVEDPADEIFAIAFLRKNTSDKDWDGFLETYGIPPIFIEGPPNVPPDKEATYQATAEKVVSDGRGYLPNQSTVHTITPGTGTAPFSERLKYLDEQIVIAGTSGKLTVLNEATGIGGSQGKVHQDTFNDVAAAQAMEVSEAMQEFFDKPLLERLFPGEPVMVYFEFAPVDEEDTEAHVSNAVELGGAGYEIDLKELSEKTGYTITKKEPAPGTQPSTILLSRQKPATINSAPAAAAQDRGGAPISDQAGSSAGQADPDLVTAAIAADVGVQARWLAPLNDLINGLIAKAGDGTISDEDLAKAVAAARKQLPDLLGQLNVGELAGAIEKALGPAAVKGLSDALRQRATATV